MGFASAPSNSQGQSEDQRSMVRSIIIEDEKGRGLYISPGANFCFQRAVYVESRTMKELVKLKQMAQDIISQATFPITNGS